MHGALRSPSGSQGVATGVPGLGSAGDAALSGGSDLPRSLQVPSCSAYSSYSPKRNSQGPLATDPDIPDTRPETEASNFSEED